MAFQGSGKKICEVRQASVDLWSPDQAAYLESLMELRTVDGRATWNPMNFRGAPLVTTVIRTGTHRPVWKMLEEAQKAFARERLQMVRKESDQLKAIREKCRRRVPISVHPSLYRALKCNLPDDVGGIIESKQISKEMAEGPLECAVGILTPDHFRPATDLK